ncbi:MAG: hypothetical protein AAGA20_07040 [Planctomycetota bacterium]
MRSKTALLSLSLLALAACGGDADAAEADIFKLVQSGDYGAAIAAAETQLASVEKGTEGHKELVVQYATALSKDKAEDAKKAFLDFAGGHGTLVEPSDFKYVVSQLRKHDHFIAAIDVMDAGKKRWPNDATMDEVVGFLKQEIASSGNAEAANKMKGLGYM